MKKIFLVLISAGLLNACSHTDKIYTPDINSRGYFKECIDGVSYLVFRDGATVQVDSSGKPVQCEKK
jgi:hypothetical protein